QSRNGHEHSARRFRLPITTATATGTHRPRAGGTGACYDADRSSASKNARRVHYRSDASASTTWSILKSKRKAPLLAWAGLELRGFQQQRQRVSSVRPFYDTHKGRPGGPHGSRVAAHGCGPTTRGVLADGRHGVAVIGSKHEGGLILDGRLEREFGTRKYAYSHRTIVRRGEAACASGEVVCDEFFAYFGWACSYTVQTVVAHIKD